MRVKADTFAKELVAAHASSSLELLAKRYPEISSFTLFIEHSLRQDNTYEISSVRGLSELSAVLKSRQTQGFPAPAARPLIRCDNNLCRYNFRQGIQHNTLYLKEFRYTLENHCLELESVWLLDGD
jgi:hypothetical protein